MLRFLFPRLTATNSVGESLFAHATRVAREPHWYREGQVPDTLDGRFCVLATVVAFILLRLERSGDQSNVAAAGLTERFVEVMESEHRELGLGDPKLGRTVRKLVSALSRRVDLWRNIAPTDESAWSEATRESLYKDEVGDDAVRSTSAELRLLRRDLDRTTDCELIGSMTQ